MPFQTWIPSWDSVLAVVYQMLQWGHALSDMDTTGCNADKGIVSYSLQWGHALSDMDTR